MSAKLDLAIKDLLKYKYITKSIQTIPSLGYKISTTFRKSISKEVLDFVNLHSELFSGNGGYRTRIAACLLYAEANDKKSLLAIISSELTRLTNEEMEVLVESKLGGENLAFALSVLQDYIWFLETDTWQGITPKFNFTDDFVKFVEIKETLGLENIDFGKNKDILKERSKGVLSELASLSPEFLAYELLLTYIELQNRRKD